MAAIVGGENVWAASEHDAVDGVPATLVVAPATAEQGAAVLKQAAQAGLAVTPRGGATKLGWGNRPRSAGIILDTRHWSALVEHAWGDMTATVQAGCSIAAFQAALATHGQRLAIDALWPEQATVGGLLATNDGGPLRVRFGGLRDQVLGMTVLLPDGTVARTGGKVVKNVAGYDVQKLMTGALGTLGVIAEATFRLYPLAADTRDCSFGYPTAEAANQALLALNDSTLAPSAVQLVAGSDQAVRLDARFEGLTAALDDQERQLGSLAAAQAAPAEDCWNARQALFVPAERVLVAKYSVLPSDLAWMFNSVARVAGPLRLQWASAAHALGVGWLRLEGANDEALLAAALRLRTDVESQHGSFSLLVCPPGIKERIDVWGSAGTAAGLMQRVKERFDPQAIMNPGRFVSGI